MRLHSIHHVPFEGLGLIEHWANARSFQVTSSWQHLGDELPEPDAIDFLVVMGGPMGVNDQNAYPWIDTELAYIRNAIDQKIPVLGVCLGAQFLAKALGAHVSPNKEKEIGWFPIRVTEAGQTHQILEGIPKAATVLHWHGERFEVPEGAIRLWASEACDNQGFICGTSLGLQFHFEMDQMDVEAICTAAETDLEPPGEYVQTKQQILSNVTHLSACKQHLFRLLDNWAELTSHSGSNPGTG